MFSKNTFGNKIIDTQPKTKLGQLGQLLAEALRHAEEVREGHARHIGVSREAVDTGCVVGRLERLRVLEVERRCHCADPKKLISSTNHLGDALHIRASVVPLGHPADHRARVKATTLGGTTLARDFGLRLVRREAGINDELLDDGEDAGQVLHRRLDLLVGRTLDALEVSAVEADLLLDKMLEGTGKRALLLKDDDRARGELLRVIAGLADDLEVVGVGTTENTHDEKDDLVNSDGIGGHGWSVSCLSVKTGKAC